MIALNELPVRWLLMLHQLPAKPAYLRVKIGRKLQFLGAVPIKNAVHALPLHADTTAAFKALVEEIVQAGGEAFVCEAQLVDGLTDAEVRALFDAGRDADYEELVQEAHALLKGGAYSATEVRRLRKRRDEISKIDFFAAHGRQTVESVLAELDAGLRRHPDVSRSDAPPPLKRADLNRRVWVTRRDIHIDRIASAWLIRRFVDPAAVFKFVNGRNYRPLAGELRFDMADAEFTHEGSDCTFETLIRRTKLEKDGALRAMAEIIHDLDIEDGRYGRPETAGLGALISGVCAATGDDDERIRLAGAGLDQFYAYFKRV